MERTRMPSGEGAVDDEQWEQEVPRWLSPRSTLGGKTIWLVVSLLLLF
jgi:hypothetical protein